VIREAEIYADSGLIFDTIYFGGGTPSSLEPEQLAAVLDGLHGHFDIDPRAQLFLEANPEDVKPDRVTAWRALGFSFVSLGVQSFDDDDEDLEFLGRRHSVAEAYRAVEVLCAGDFHTVSIDLIYGLQGRACEHWRRQLETALRLGVQHLSCYQLTIHEETLLGRRLARGKITEVGDEELSELFFLTHGLCAEAGYEGYEVSNFASAPDHRSKHNQKYWDHTPYIGLGPSAHSFAGGRRWWNRRKLRLWQSAIDLGQNPREGEERPSQTQLALEALMLGFRTTAGVDLNHLRERFEVDLIERNQDVIDRFHESGHLEVDDDRLRPTVAGLAIADSLARSFEV
jgi:oxygen-independent coproporphyrinogen-3 oxidase